MTDQEAHQTTWVPYSNFWGSPLVIHTLGDRRVVGYLAGYDKDHQPIFWWDLSHRLHTHKCKPNDCTCGWWGGDHLDDEKSALEWLYSNRSIHLRDEK